MKSLKRWIALLVVFTMVAGLGIHQFGNSLKANEADVEEPTTEAQSTEEAAVPEDPAAEEPEALQDQDALVSEVENEGDAEKAEYTITIKEPETDGGSIFAWTDGSKEKVEFTGGEYAKTAEEGTTFHMEIKAKSNYEVSKVTDGSGNAIATSSVSGSTYSYEMADIAADQQINITYSKAAKAADKKDSSSDSKKEEAAADDDEESEPASAKAADTVLTTTVGSTVITVTAPAGALPEGAYVKAFKADSFIVEKTMKDAAEAEGKELVDYAAFNITIYDKDGVEIQPDDTVKVMISGVMVQGGEKNIYHITSEGAEKVDGTATGSTAVFNAEHFSIYVVGGTYTIDPDTGVILLAVGDTITLECDGNHNEHDWKLKNNKDSNDKKYVKIDGNDEGKTVTLEGKRVSGNNLITVYCKNDNNRTYIKVVDSSSVNKVVWLTFNANGGYNAPAAITGKVDDKVTLPDAGNMTHEEGYTFMGWGKTAKSGMANSSDKIIYPAGETYTLTKSETLYAIWATSQEAEYYIRLDGQIPQEPGSYSESAYTASSDDMKGTVKYNTFYANTSGVDSHLDVKPSTSAIRNACNDKVGEIKFGDGTDYEFCDSDDKFESEYYVLWYVIKQSPIHVDGVLLKKDLYNVTYDPNAIEYSGNIPIGQQYPKGKVVTVTENKLSRNGYEFLGWSEDQTATTAQYTSGDTFNMPAENVVLYAVWKEKNAVTYTYTPDPASGGTVSRAGESVNPVSGKAQGSVATAKPGYKFLGWYAKDDDELITSENASQYGASLNEDGTELTPVKTNDVYTGGEFVAKFAVDDSQTKPTLYTVRHEVDGVVQTEDTKIYTGTVWINEENPTIVVEEGSLAPNTYTGYKFSEIDPVTKEGNSVASGSVITLKYVKDASQTQPTKYTVHYTINGVEQTKDKLEVTGTAWVNDDPAKIAIAEGGIPAPADKYTGYKLDTANPDYPAAGTLVKSGSEYTINYVKDASQTKPTSYTVKHVIGDEVKDTETYTGTAWINEENPMIEIQAGSVDEKSYTGYKFAAMSPELKAGDSVFSGSEIILTYVKDDEATKTLEYTVKYVVGGKEVSSTTYTEAVWVNDGDDIAIQAGSIEQKTFEGYKFESITDNVKEGDKVKSKTVITLNYVADFSDLSAKGIEKAYDGNASTITVNGTIDGDTVEFFVGDKKVDNSFKNVGQSAKVVVKVTRGSETWTDTVDVTITPLNVTLKSADLAKAFDGNPLTNGSTPLETETGFIEGEGAEYIFTGTQTAIGSSPNKFEYELKDNTLAENYNIFAESGRLTVTPADNPPVTPGGNPAGPVSPDTVIRAVTGAPPAVAAVLGGALDNAAAAVRELITDEDEDVPLANMKGEHKCCIFHFLLMLLALIILALYTRSMKKRQKEIFELREKIDEERAKRGLPPVQKK